MPASPSNPAWDLELSGEQLRQMVGAALDYIAPHIDSLPEQPAADAEGGVELARALVEPIPRAGAPLQELLALLFERAIPKSFNTAGPGYLAYIPGGGLLHSAVADLIADAVNRYTGVFAAAPGLVQLETNVMAWFAQIVGYPPSARGVLTSGGSLANFMAIFTARRERLPENFHNATLYASDQAHHSVLRAAILAGFPAGNVRAVPTDDRFRLDPSALGERIAADRRTGHRPFLIIANAGTTNTGAVDPFPALADLAQREECWLHVDAAYGGFFCLTDRGRTVLRGIERADSIVLDPHKGLFLPYGTGALLVRDGAALHRAHEITAEYLPPMQHDEDLIDFCAISPELSRPFRGLRVWLPFKLLGSERFARELAEKLTLAEAAATTVRNLPDMEMLAEPELSLFAFRWHPPGLDEPALNALNRELLARVNRRNRVHITATLLDSRYALRICVLSFRTHAERLEAGLDDLRDAMSELQSQANARSDPR